MSPRRVRIVAFKELRDITRDRRALLFMIVLPIAVVPLLMLVMGKLVSFGAKKLLTDASKVAVLNAKDAPHLVRALQFFERPAAVTANPVALLRLRAEMPEVAEAIMEEIASPRIEEAVGRLVTDLEPEKVNPYRIVEPPADVAAARRLVKEKELEAAVVIPDGFESGLERDGQEKVEVVYDSSVDKSKVAYNKVNEVLKKYERGVVLLRFAAKGIDKSLLDPVQVKAATIATREEEGRAILAYFLPYMLILMCLSGAMYPAIDLGAGEKERGTLETLLVCPAERSELVIGKFLVVFVTSLVAAMLNIASLVFSFSSGAFPEIGKAVKVSIDPAGAGVALLLMLPVAAIFAAVLLSISIFAKSFKEAQAYFGPFNIVIIVPAFFSMIPGVELNRGFALVPIVNVSLAIKETLSGVYKWDCLALILISTALLAGACLAFCSQWFKREQVLFRS